jgi:hypothetical protein
MQVLLHRGAPDIGLKDQQKDRWVIAAIKPAMGQLSLKEQRLSGGQPVGLVLDPVFQLPM